MSSRTTVDFQRRGKTLIIRVCGPLDGYRQQWQAKIEKQREKAGGDVILNLAEAEFIDSRGMGFVLSLHRALNAAGRRLMLVVKSDVVQDSFEAAGITSMLRVYTSEQLALEEATA